MATQRYTVIAVSDSTYLDLLFDTDKVMMDGTIRFPFPELPQVVVKAYAIDAEGKILTYGEPVKTMVGKNYDQVVTYSVPYMTDAGEEGEFVCTEVHYDDLDQAIKDAYEAWKTERALEFSLTVNHVITYVDATGVKNIYAIEAINDAQK